MINLQDYIERAMLMNVDKQYLDIDHIFYYSNSEVSINLHEYLKYIGYKDGDIQIVSIPELVSIVYIDIKELGTLCFNHRIKFEFPSTLRYFGTKWQYIKNGYIYLYHNDGLSELDFKGFKGVSLDFSKCAKIIDINKYSFFSFYLDTLLLPETIGCLSSSVFENSHIKSIIAKGVSNLESSAFKDAYIDELVLNDRLNTLESKSLALKTPLSKLIVEDMSFIQHYVFGEVKELYLPYNLNNFAVEHLEMIQRVYKEIVDNISNIYYCRCSINELYSDLSVQIDSFRYDLEVAIGDYLMSDSSDNDDERLSLITITTHLFSLYNNEMKIYYYKSEDCNNIEEREYERVNTEDMKEELIVYVER